MSLIAHCLCGPRRTYPRVRIADASRSVSLLDPTGTLPVRRKFKADMDRRWAKMRRLVLEALGTNDILGISPTVATILHSSQFNPAHTPLPGGDKVKSFQSWIDEAMRQIVMGYSGAWVGKYIEDAGKLAGVRAGRLTGRTVDAGPEDEARDPKGQWTSSGGATGTPEFKAWFGNSKVVDEHGKPQVVYHGTTAEFEQFRKSRPRSNDNSYARDRTVGIFFTNNPEGADFYASTEGKQSKSAGPNIIPVYLSLKNPKVIEWEGRVKGPDHVIGWANEAKAAGNDGLIIKNVRDTPTLGEGDKPENIYIVFNPKQIKSAISNTGKFDPKKPGIRDASPLNRLQALISLTQTELQGVCEAVSQQAVRAVANGILFKKRPAKIAREVSERINAIGKVRSHLLVQFMVVKAHAAATLDAFRSAGIKQVGTQAERLRIVKGPHGKTLAHDFNPNHEPAGSSEGGRFAVSGLGAVAMTDKRRQQLKDLMDKTPGLKGVLPYLSPDEVAKVRSTSAQTIVDMFSKINPEEMAAVAFSGQEKRGWYKESAKALVDIFGARDAPRFAGLLAATSPQTGVEDNAINALHIWKNWIDAGRPTDKQSITAIMGKSVQGGKGEGSILPTWIPNTVRALSAADPENITLSGPKVDSFMRNLRGEVNAVTLDTWMGNYKNIDPDVFRKAGGALPSKGPSYIGYSAAVRAASDVISQRTGNHWTPAEVQETVWSWAKTLYEKVGKDQTATDLLKASGLTHKDIKETPDFATMFTQGVYKNILEGAGYGQQVKQEAAIAASRGAVPGGNRAGSSALSAEGSGFTQDDFTRHLLSAAGRLDALRIDRAHAKTAKAKVKDYDPNEARDPHGMWTAGGGNISFLSPNVGTMNFGEAKAALNSSQQQQLHLVMSDVDRTLSMDTASRDVIGAWKDGAENSTLNTATGISWDDWKTNQAMKGYLANQKQVLVFQAGDGTDFLAHFDVKGSVDEIHQRLLDKGLEFHTLEPSTEGARVYVYGSDQKSLDTARNAADAEKSILDVVVGHGEFIGTKKEDGSDAEQRADAQRIYQGIVRSSRMPGIQGRWNALRDRHQQFRDAAPLRLFDLLQSTIERREAKIAELGEVDVLTAGDDLVCEECLSISDDGPYDLDTAESLIPAHPSCRCAFVPIDDERFAEVGDANPYHEPAGSSVGGQFASGPGGGEQVTPSLKAEAMYPSAVKSAFAAVAKTPSNENVLALHAEEAKAEALAAKIEATRDVTRAKALLTNPGGDEWNKQTAIRLENEYQKSKPELEKIVTDAVEGKAAVPERAPDEEDDTPVVPDEWESMSSDQQTETQDKWIENNKQEFVDNEITNWHDNGDAKDDAAYLAVDNIHDDDKNDWLYEALQEHYDEREEEGKSEIPFTRMQIVKALDLSYEAYGSGNIEKGLKFGFDETKLNEPKGFETNQLTLPGVEPLKPEEMLTKDMRDDIQAVVTKALDDEADKQESNMEPPEYLSKSAEEYMPEYFDNMDEKKKFELAQEYGVISSEENIVAKADFYKTIDKLPEHFDPLQTGASNNDYQRTQALARYLSVERAAQLMKQRGISGSTYTPLTYKTVELTPEATADHDGAKFKVSSWKEGFHNEALGYFKTKEEAESLVTAERTKEDAKEKNSPVTTDDVSNRDSSLWTSWKGSSSSPEGKLLQVATADELGGRLHEYKGVDRKEAIDFANVRFKSIGGYDGVKAYIRAKWETSQYMMDKADLHTVSVYRGINLPGVDNQPSLIKEEVQTPYEGGGHLHYTKLPDLMVKRNGAASTSTDASVSNHWDGSKDRVVLRAEVPRTSVLSVPAYGINMQSEHEVVVAGTSWVGWDAWKDHAPTFHDVPMKHGGFAA